MNVYLDDHIHILLLLPGISTPSHAKDRPTHECEALPSTSSCAQGESKQTMVETPRKKKLKRTIKALQTRLYRTQENSVSSEVGNSRNCDIPVACKLVDALLPKKLLIL